MAKKKISKLESRLLGLGVDLVLITDDTQVNLDSAREAFKKFNEICFEFYSNGKTVIDQIPDRYREIGLILTDLDMENPTSGLDVVEKAWSYSIPAFICTGGYQHRDQPFVVVAPDTFNIGEGYTKDRPETWAKILDSIATKAEDGTNLTSAIFRARQAKVPVPELFYGEQARKITQDRLYLAKQLGHYSGGKK